MNRVQLLGNCTRDTELLTTQGTPMARLRIATTSSWRNSAGERQEATDFHSAVAFSRLAEICRDYCNKGRQVFLEGRLRTRDYTGSDGVRRFVTEIIAENVRLLGAPVRRADADAEPEPEAALDEPVAARRRVVRRKAA